MGEKEFNELSLPVSERWENLTLANDFLFGKVMSDAELCTEMIKRILPDIDIGRVEFTRSQKSEKPSLDTRGVRFDVYAKSANRKIFDCEVQTTDKKDLERRTRAYHIVLGLEALETETLKKSGSYKDLPDAFVIFVCTFDPFNSRRHIYTFRNVCQEDSELKLNDGAFTIFLNARGKADDISVELKAFLDFMLGKTSDDPFIKKLENRLKEAKGNAEWRREYMLLLLREQEKYSEGVAVGEERGRSETLSAAIEFMRSSGMSSEQINKFRASVLKS